MPADVYLMPIKSTLAIPITFAVFGHRTLSAKVPFSNVNISNLEDVKRYTQLVNCAVKLIQCDTKL